jgi:hypothetical protein
MKWRRMLQKMEEIFPDPKKDPRKAAQRREEKRWEKFYFADLGELLGDMSEEAIKSVIAFWLHGLDPHGGLVNGPIYPTYADERRHYPYLLVRWFTLCPPSRREVAALSLIHRLTNDDMESAWLRDWMLSLARYQSTLPPGLKTESVEAIIKLRLDRPDDLDPNGFDEVCTQCGLLRPKAIGQYRTGGPHGLIKADTWPDFGPCSHCGGAAFVYAWTSGERRYPWHDAFQAELDAEFRRTSQKRKAA